MTDDDGILVFNPLPWERSVSGPIPDHVLDPRGVPGDETAARHFQDRDLERRPISGLLDGEGAVDQVAEGPLLPPTDVPGYGYATVSGDELVDPSAVSFDERATVETDRYRLTFDRETGGVERWYDRRLDCEWVDPDAEYPLGGFVHEQVADREADRPRRRLFHFDEDLEDPFAAAAGLLDAPRGFQSDWHAVRTGPERVRRHRVYDTPLGVDVRQTLAVPPVESDVSLRVFVPHEGDTVVVDARWEMGLDTHPEATYLAFPFALSDPTPHVDVGAQAMEPGADQLEGTAYDYYTAQDWVDLSVADRGMTVGCPLNPMVQFGDFHFADDQDGFALDDGLLLGWVTNNYWDTNFRARQPGRVTARYHLTPHAGGFDEAAAHRLGREARHWRPLAQTLAEGAVESAPLAPRGQLLDLPEPPVVVTQVRPAGRDVGRFHPGADTPEATGDLLVALRNAGDEPATATFGSGQLRIAAAERTDVFGAETRDELDATGDTVAVDLVSRETATVRLDCHPASE